MTDPEHWGPTEVIDIASDAVDDAFRLFVTACGPEPSETLIVADGTGLFGLVADTIRLMQIPALVPPMLVVGVGYPAASVIADTVGIRVRDLTPSVVEGFDGSGGADAFRSFIADELMPWLSDRHPGATGRTTFFGHSLGGLFGAHVMLTRPATFDRYILSSPSLWWDRHRILDEVTTAAGLAEIEASVFAGIGALETDEGRRLEAADLPDGHPAKPPEARLDMVDDLRRFVEALAARDLTGLDLWSEVFPDEFHATVPGVVLSRALRAFAIADRG